jgi:DNA-binding beta-propeller fold protein YncE
VAAPLVFFPAPPDLPRIQFLTSFAGLRDVQKQSGFERFVVGENQDVRVNKPYGLDVFDGKVYVCDTNSTVVVFDFKSKTFGPLKGAVGAGLLRQPTNINITADGTKFVSDPVRRQVVVFDRFDAYVRAYGDAASWRPVDAFPVADRLYVVDTAAAVVRIVDRASGQTLATIGDKGDPSERLSRPTNVTADRAGDIYVTDLDRFQVVRFDANGTFKRTFGKAGDNRGHFARPKGIAVDRAGRLYAVDAAFNNVQIFDRDGRFLMFFGESGEAPGGLLLPAKVVIDYDNLKYFQRYLQPGFQAEYLVFVTSQVGGRRVSVFAFGKDQGTKYPDDEELLRLIEERRKREQEKPN